jgi:hypothetical protein
MKVVGIVLVVVGALGLLSVAQLFLVNPDRVRQNFIGMVILPGALAALGAFLWKKSQPIDAEIVDDPPENPVS